MVILQWFYVASGCAWTAFDIHYQLSVLFQLLSSPCCRMVPSSQWPCCTTVVSTAVCVISSFSLRLVVVTEWIAVSLVRYLICVLLGWDSFTFDSGLQSCFSTSKCTWYNNNHVCETRVSSCWNWSIWCHAYTIHHHHSVAIYSPQSHLVHLLTPPQPKGQFWWWRSVVWL